MPKGSWAYGERWSKICIDCQKEKVWKIMERDIKKILDRVKKGEANLKLNWEKYQRDNTLANLSYNE